MIDYHTSLVTALNSILPTHYEMTLTSGTATPCISYMEISNNDGLTGSTIGYSTIRYQVKVWATDIEIIQRYALEIDSKLRSIGFKRVSSNEMYDNQSSMIQKIMSFECLALEQY